MMSKRIISFFTFGILLIVVGVILKVLDKPQADILMAIGLVFESLAVLLFVWNKLKQK